MILDGKKLAEEALSKIKFHNEHLAIIVVGENPASEIYVRKKINTLEKLGGKGTVIRLKENADEKELGRKIEELNKDKKVNGIIVQLPLPKHINTLHVLSKINPLKDVDGITPQNLGKLFSGNPDVIPATPKGILYLLKKYNIGIEGKDAVIAGRSLIVGRPMAALLLNENATVTICHSRTRNLISYAKKADILIVAAGQPNLIKKDMVKPGATVIDVGINRVDGKIVGDCDFDEIKNIANVSPVPGGVGPLTIAMLMENLKELTK